MDPFAVVNQVADIVAALLRLLGLGVLGFGLGMFSLELFRKGQQAWQFQSFLYIGLILLIGTAIRFAPPAAFAGLAFGLGFSLIAGLRQPKDTEKKTL
jgi:hypothetical protein